MTNQELLEKVKQNLSLDFDDNKAEMYFSIFQMFNKQPMF